MTSALYWFFQVLASLRVLYHRLSQCASLPASPGPGPMPVALRLRLLSGSRGCSAWERGTTWVHLWAQKTVVTAVSVSCQCATLAAPISASRLSRRGIGRRCIFASNVVCSCTFKLCFDLSCALTKLCFDLGSLPVAHPNQSHQSCVCSRLQVQLPAVSEGLKGVSKFSHGNQIPTCFMSIIVRVSVSVTVQCQ